MSDFNTVFEDFKRLSLNDQQRLLDAGRQVVKFSNYNLRAGAKVCFKHGKTGAMIDGVFIRMKQKYAEVSSTQDKHGIDRGYPMRWSVPPEMLRMVQS